MNLVQAEIWMGDAWVPLTGITRLNEPGEAATLPLEPVDTQGDESPHIVLLKKLTYHLRDGHDFWLHTETATIYWASSTAGQVRVVEV